MNFVRLSSVLLFAICGGCSIAPPGGSPPGYNLGAPEKFVMSEDLHEISGIVLMPGKPDTVCAIEDEEGQLYYFRLGERKFPSRKFWKKGDYEDVAIQGGSRFVVLRSDGSLFSMPLDFPQNGNRDSVTRYEHILPEGEYEGLFGDEDGSLVALCKNCKQDDQRDAVSGYVLRAEDGLGLAVAGQFTVDISGMNVMGKKNKKEKFHPSCLARHPITKEWYIISSVNKALLVLDDHWKLKEAHRLNVNLFKQPEGLAFDSKGNMYVSNEGDEGDGNILLFKYNRAGGKKKKDVGASGEGE